MRSIIVCCGLSAALGAMGLAVEDPGSRLHPFYVCMAFFAAVQAVGAALIALGARRAGAIVVMVGAWPLVPLGLLGVMGARGVLDFEAEARFRRNVLHRA